MLIGEAAAAIIFSPMIIKKLSLGTLLIRRSYAQLTDVRFDLGMGIGIGLDWLIDLETHKTLRIF